MRVEARIEGMMAGLTAAERKAATALLADYPFAGLLTLTELAKRARVSVQTILRLTGKIGFQGYGAFQRALIGEIKEGYHSPVILRETILGEGQGEGQGEGMAGKGDRSFLQALSEAAVASVRETVATQSESQFDTVCDLLSDRRRTIFLIGGRMSHSLATFLFRHLRQIRPRVRLLPEYQEEWPEYLLAMNRRDLLLVFDYRRYQTDLAVLAHQAARERGAQVILFTDKWLSPVSRDSSHILPASVDVGTPWDTSLGPLLMVEAIINKVAEQDWPSTRKRIESWDGLRSSTPTGELALDERDKANSGDGNDR